MSIAAGHRFGPYEVVEYLAEGGMGEVWKALDTRLDRVVAVKISKEEFTERFEHEARAVASLNHPHICQLYDVGPTYLVMEFVEGSLLKGPLPLDRAIQYGCQMLEALDCAHRKGITHRDLKPSNIMVTRQGIKLLDFGLAKRHITLLRQDEDTVTRGFSDHGKISGTLQYMSPEQLQGRAVDPRSDLFSFGCVFYEMLSGRKAFDGDTAASIIAAIIDREPAPIRVSAGLDRVIRRCLDKDPDQRFQNALDLRFALQWSADKEVARDVSMQTRRRWMAASAGALVVGATGGWALSRRLAPRPERVMRFDIGLPDPSTVFATNPGGVALSPDGTMAAFTASISGSTSIWLRRLDEPAARKLTGTDAAAQPFWSPDSRFIGYVAAGKIMRVEAAGGSPVALNDSPGFGGGTWTNDGRILFGSRTGLLQMPEGGGPLRPFTTANLEGGEYGHAFPQALPGGQVLFLCRSRKAELVGIYGTTLQDPKTRVRILPITSTALSASGYLLWRRGQALVAQAFDPKSFKLKGEIQSIVDPVGAVQGEVVNMSASSNGVLLYGAFGRTLTQLVWFDRTGKKLAPLGDPAEIISFRLSPDGRRVALSLRDTDTDDIWVMDTDRGLLTRLTVSGFAEQPVWSPDGTSILYSSGRPLSLFRTDAGGGGVEERVTTATLVQYATEWTTDAVVFNETGPGRKRDIVMLPVGPSGTAQPKYFLQTQFDEWEGRVSPGPGPRWLAYRSDESGRFEVYIREFPEGRAKVRVSVDGGRFPVWAAGGREIFFVSPDNKLMVADVRLSASTAEVSTPRVVFELPVYQSNACPYDVTPDGKRILVRTALENPQSLSVVVNWPAMLDT
jgi:Tol biopolymer transport system component/predicted Ser/Thr protein kinase